MNWPLLITAGVLLLGSLLLSPQAAGAFTWLKGLLPTGSSAPDRDAAVKAYDTLKAYSADKPGLAEKLKGIWGELE